METFIESLLQKQRADIHEGKLGKIDKDKLKSIVTRTSISFDHPNVYNECWIWNGTMSDNAKGHCHGSIWFNKSYVLVHRLMYHNFIDHVPPFERRSNSMQVNHKCLHEHNGRCINPWHCYLGSAQQNTQDAMNDCTKYKMPCGQQNINATLSDAIVEEIKALKGNTTLSQSQIAKKYGVSQSQISRWWNNKTRK